MREKMGRFEQISVRNKMAEIYDSSGQEHNPHHQPQGREIWGLDMCMGPEQHPRVTESQRCKSKDSTWQGYKGTLQRSAR